MCSAQYVKQDISEEKALLSAEESSLELANSIYQRNKIIFKSSAVSQESYDMAQVDLAVVKPDIVRLQSVMRKKLSPHRLKVKQGFISWNKVSFCRAVS